MKNAHSPEELAALSTTVHNVIGWVLLALAIALVVEIARGVTAGKLRFLWPGLGAAVGIGLAGFVFFHQWLFHGVGPFSDPVQNQHQAIGWLAGLGSLVEVFRRAGRIASPRAAVAWPFAIVGIGLVFLAHEQGTAEALLVHWALAATLILAGLAQAAPALVGDESRPLRAFGAMLLAGAALQLVVYAEEPGAHGAHQEHTGHP